MRLLILSSALVVAVGCSFDLKTGLRSSASSSRPGKRTAPADTRASQPHSTAPTNKSASATKARATKQDKAPAGATNTGRMAGVAWKSRSSRAEAPDAEAFARSCFAAYDDLLSRWAPHEARHRAQLGKIKKLRNYYAQRAAITELGNQIAADARAAGLGATSWQFVVRGGFAHELEMYLAELNRERGIPRIKLPLKTFLASVSNDTLAGDLFCHNSTRSGNHVHRSMSWLHFVNVLPEPRARALSAYLRQYKKLASEELAPAPWPKKRQTMLGLPRVFGKGEVLSPGTMIEAAGKVASVSTSKSGATVRVTMPLGASAQHGCVETRKVDRIDTNGRIRYRERCNRTFSKTQVELSIRFADVPAGLRKGDWIDFDAVIGSTRVGKRHRRTGAPSFYKAKLKGLLVTKHARAKKKGDRTDQYEVLATY